MSSLTTTTSKPTFTLYRGWLTPNQFVWSPFVTKLELRLRLSNITTYKSEAGSTSQSPKGKIPYITITSTSTSTSSPTSSQTISDSTLIIKHLIKESHLDDLNTNLTPQNHLEDLAIRSLLEEKLYFYHMHERWITNYYAHRDYILSHMSVPVRTVVGLLIYRSITATLHGQGTGRLGAEEIEMYRYEIWEGLERRLMVSKKKGKASMFEGESESGSRPFWILGGERPTEADATLFGFISSVLVSLSCPRSQEVVRGFPTVMEYANRIFETYFSDFQHWG